MHATVNQTFLGDVFLGEAPQAAAAAAAVETLLHKPLPHQPIGRPVDIDVEPERQEMVVVDCRQVGCDQRPISRIPHRGGIGHRARRHALDLVDAGGADIDAKDARLGQHPVDDVIVIADARD